MFENIKQSKSFRKTVLEWYQEECLFLMLDENKVLEFLSSLSMSTLTTSWHLHKKKKKNFFPEPIANTLKCE